MPKTAAERVRNRAIHRLVCFAGDYSQGGANLSAELPEDSIPAIQRRAPAAQALWKSRSAGMVARNRDSAFGEGWRQKRFHCDLRLRPCWAA